MPYCYEIAVGLIVLLRLRVSRAGQSPEIARARGDSTARRVGLRGGSAGARLARVGLRYARVNPIEQIIPVPRARFATARVAHGSIRLRLRGRAGIQRRGGSACAADRLARRIGLRRVLRRIGLRGGLAGARLARVGLRYARANPTEQIISVPRARFATARVARAGRSPEIARACGDSTARRIGWGAFGEGWLAIRAGQSG